jgi:hypothetical protein
MFAVIVNTLILSSCSSCCGYRPVTFACVSFSAPQGLLHPVGGVLGEFQADVRVALGRQDGQVVARMNLEPP